MLSRYSQKKRWIEIEGFGSDLNQTSQDRDSWVPHYQFYNTFHKKKPHHFGSQRRSLNSPCDGVTSLAHQRRGTGTDGPDGRDGWRDAGRIRDLEQQRRMGQVRVPGHRAGEPAGRPGARASSERAHEQANSNPACPALSPTALQPNRLGPLPICHRCAGLLGPGVALRPTRTGPAWRAPGRGRLCGRGRLPGHSGSRTRALPHTTTAAAAH